MAASYPSLLGGTFFVTFRLDDALPRSFMLNQRLQFYVQQTRCADLPNDARRERLRTIRKRLFAHYDEALHQALYGHCYFKDPALSKIVADVLHQFDGSLYDLLAYTILPNHVHVLINTNLQLPHEPALIDLENYECTALRDILRQVKNTCGQAINQAIKRDGRLWQRENFDHWVYTEHEFDNILQFIQQNPVRAGLVEKGEDWGWNYCKERANNNL